MFVIFHDAVALHRRQWNAILVAGVLLLVLGESVHYHLRSSRLNGHSRAVTTRHVTVVPSDPRIPAMFYGHLFRSQARRMAQNTVCLTFDDGPSKVYTPQVLDILREQNVRATFFLVGRFVRRHPDVVRRAYDEGHALGVHSYDHTWRRHLSGKEGAWQVDATAQAIQEITGERPMIYRPPFGRIHNSAITNAARFRYYAIVMWTVDSQDRAHTLAQEIFSHCMASLRPGDILLFHDGGLHREPMIKAFPFIIAAARAKGLTFVTVPECMRLVAHAQRERVVRAKQALPLSF